MTPGSLDEQGVATARHTDKATARYLEAQLSRTAKEVEDYPVGPGEAPGCGGTTTTTTWRSSPTAKGRGSSAS